MKKFLISLFSGSVLGFLLSFLFMDYEKTSYEIFGQAGIARRIVNDMDIDFIFNASLFILGCTFVIFVIWTYVEKKTDEKFYDEFRNK